MSEQETLRDFRELEDALVVMTETAAVSAIYADGLRARVEQSEAEVKRLRGALRDILGVSQDRERFVRLGPRGWVKAEQIARTALDAQPKR